MDLVASAFFSLFSYSFFPVPPLLLHNLCYTISSTIDTNLKLQVHRILRTTDAHA